MRGVCVSDEMRVNLELLFAYCFAASYSYYYHVCIVSNAVYMMGGSWSVQQKYGQFVLGYNDNDFVDSGCTYYIANFPQSIPIAYVNQSDHRRIIISKNKREYDAAVSSINHSMISDEEILVCSFLSAFFCVTLSIRFVPDSNIKVNDFAWFFALFVILVNVIFNAYVRDKIGLGLCQMLQNIYISDGNLQEGYDPLAAFISNITIYREGLGYHIPYYNGGTAANYIYFNNVVCSEPWNFIILVIGAQVPVLIFALDPAITDLNNNEFLRYSPPYRMFLNVRDFTHGPREKINLACKSVYARCCYRNHGLFGNQDVCDYGAIGSSANNNENTDDCAALGV